MMMSRKASFQLGVNFLVVLIICIVLLGIGIKLIPTLLVQANNQQNDMEQEMRQKLMDLLDDGALVTAYPDRDTVSRGETAKFGLGVRNELGTDQYFMFKVERDADNSPPCTPKIIRTPNEFLIKNNAQDYKLIAIEIPKDCQRGTPSSPQIFNIYVCNTTNSCYKESPDRYGDLQKIYVYLK